MKNIIQQKLDQYNPKSSEEEENYLKEITQEVVLYSLYKAGFFKEASFIGGTCLRVIYGVDRFSEDLDFSTIKVDNKFNLENYIEKALVQINAYGYDLSISGKDNIDSNIKSRFLKDDSIKRVLTFKHPTDSRTKIKIKVEIDTNPPKFAERKMEYVSFPLDFPVMTYDLSSLFAGKIHAILCRPYTKGRDLFDFLWYQNNDVTPNYKMLKSALLQLGPWSEKKSENKKLIVDAKWLKTELTHKMESINWKDAKLDVRKFLKPERQESLELWNSDFFISKINKIIKIQ